MKIKPMSYQSNQNVEITNSGETENIHSLKMQISEKTNKILELNEKLGASSDTINALEERIASLLTSQQ